MRTSEALHQTRLVTIGRIQPTQPMIIHTQWSVISALLPLNALSRS